MGHGQGRLQLGRDRLVDGAALLLAVPPLRAVQTDDAAGAVRPRQGHAFPDKVMPSMLRDLKPCDVGNSLSGPQCQLRYWDSMTEEARAEARAKGGLPRSWT
jgi:hypothetical protein